MGGGPSARKNLDLGSCTNCRNRAPVDGLSDLYEVAFISLGFGCD